MNKNRLLLCAIILALSNPLHGMMTSVERQAAIKIELRKPNPDFAKIDKLLQGMSSGQNRSFLQNETNKRKAALTRGAPQKAPETLKQTLKTIQPPAAAQPAIETGLKLEKVQDIGQPAESNPTDLPPPLEPDVQPTGQPGTVTKKIIPATSQGEITTAQRIPLSTLTKETQKIIQPSTAAQSAIATSLQQPLAPAPQKPAESNPTDLPPLEPDEPIQPTGRPGTVTQKIIPATSQGEIVAAQRIPLGATTHEQKMQAPPLEEDKPIQPTGKPGTLTQKIVPATTHGETTTFQYLLATPSVKTLPAHVQEAIMVYHDVKRFADNLFQYSNMDQKSNTADIAKAINIAVLFKSSTPATEALSKALIDVMHMRVDKTDPANNQKALDTIYTAFEIAKNLFFSETQRLYSTDQRYMLIVYSPDKPRTPPIDGTGLGMETVGAFVTDPRSDQLGTVSPYNDSTLIEILRSMQILRRMFKIDWNANADWRSTSKWESYKDNKIWYQMINDLALTGAIAKANFHLVGSRLGTTKNVDINWTNPHNEMDSLFWGPNASNDIFNLGAQLTTQKIDLNLPWAKGLNQAIKEYNAKK